MRTRRASAHPLSPLFSIASVAFVAFVAFASAFMSPRVAEAQQLGRAGAKGHLVFDQLSGFRAGYDSGFTYYGIVGFAVQRYTLGIFGPGDASFDGDASVNTTTFFISPSVDYFVIDRLSIGAHVELAFTSGSVERRVNRNVTQTTDLPTTTSVTLLPRIGYMIDLSNRWAIWPRLGFGYTSQHVVRRVTAPASYAERFGAAVFDLDVGFLYRFNESFFLRMGPEVSFTSGGTRSVTSGGTTISTSANLVQFTGMLGIGGMLDLL